MLPHRDPKLTSAVAGTHASGREVTDEDLLSEVAHAFRTPLGVITGYVELLQLRDDAALRADALPRIGEAAERLAQAIDRLVSVLEFDSGELARRFLQERETQGRDGTRARTEVGQVLRASNGRDTKRVVIVDDDDEIRELLLRTLPADGFEILEARDGHEALALVEREAPDLLVLDWNMPNATGGDVLAELSRLDRRVPVIVLTADDEPKRREIAEAHGTGAFLAKPFSPIELLRAIERLLA